MMRLVCRGWKVYVDARSSFVCAVCEDGGVLDGVAEGVGYDRVLNLQIRIKDPDWGKAMGCLPPLDMPVLDKLTGVKVLHLPQGIFGSPWDNHINLLSTLASRFPNIESLHIPFWPSLDAITPVLSQHFTHLVFLRLTIFTIINPTSPPHLNLPNLQILQYHFSEGSPTAYPSSFSTWDLPNLHSFYIGRIPSTESLEHWLERFVYPSLGSKLRTFGIQFEVDCAFDVPAVFWNKCPNVRVVVADFGQTRFSPPIDPSQLEEIIQDGEVYDAVILNPLLLGIKEAIAIGRAEKGCCFRFVPHVYPGNLFAPKRSKGALRELLGWGFEAVDELGRKAFRDEVEVEVGAEPGEYDVHGGGWIALKPYQASF